MRCTPRWRLCAFEQQVLARNGFGIWVSYLSFVLIFIIICDKFAELAVGYAVLSSGEVRLRATKSWTLQAAVADTAPLFPRQKVNNEKPQNFDPFGRRV